MQMVGMRVGHEHRVEPRTPASSSCSRRSGEVSIRMTGADLDQHRHAAAPIARIGGVAPAPIRADRRHAGGGAAAEDGDPHAAAGPPW